jgi:hypothetical protein
MASLELSVAMEDINRNKADLLLFNFINVIIEVLTLKVNKGDCLDGSYCRYKCT